RGPAGQPPAVPAAHDLAGRRLHGPAEVRPLRGGGGGGHRGEAGPPTRAPPRGRAGPPHPLTPGPPRPPPPKVFPPVLYSWPAEQHVFGAGCKSPPAVTVRDPPAASRGWTR